MTPPPPTSTLFPYTTLFRSSDRDGAGARRLQPHAAPAHPLDDLSPQCHRGCGAPAQVSRAGARGGLGGRAPSVEAESDGPHRHDEPAPAIRILHLLAAHPVSRATLR